MDLSNHIRYYFFISRVLSGQESDPVCGVCKAFANSVGAVRESLEEFELEHGPDIAEATVDLRLLFSEAKESLSDLNSPVEAVGQKKAGNCAMPAGVCFIKSSKAILEKIS